MRAFVNLIDPRLVGTAAYGAAEVNRPEAMRKLHELRADFDKPKTTVLGSAPAHMAAQNGHTAMVQLLHDLGADVHRACNDGGRPIHAAAHGGHDKAVLLLLSLRASIDAQANEDRTPCWEAAFRGHARVVRLLVMHRAPMELTGPEHTTPLWGAVQENKLECIAVLAAAKASLEGAKASPIGIAAYKGADECVRLLAYLGVRLIEPAAPDWPGGPFWRSFKVNKGRVRDPAVWERIVAEGGDEDTPESLQKRIRMLKEAKVHDPRDGTSW